MKRKKYRSNDKKERSSDSTKAKAKTANAATKGESHQGATWENYLREY